VTETSLSSRFLLSSDAFLNASSNGFFDSSWNNPISSQWCRNFDGVGVWSAVHRWQIHSSHTHRNERIIHTFYHDNCLQLQLHVTLANYIKNYFPNGANMSKTCTANSLPADEHSFVQVRCIMLQVTTISVSVVHGQCGWYCYKWML